MNAGPFKEGDPVIYAKLEARRLVDVTATFVRYQRINYQNGVRDMAIIRVDSTGRTVQVATTSIRATSP